MHTVVLGWFGASAVWFLPLIWRLVRSVLPGGVGLRGPGTIRLWLGFVCVLVASCTLEAMALGIAGIDGFGHLLASGFTRVLGHLAAPLAMTALLLVSLPWFLEFRWIDFLTWADLSLGLGLGLGARAAGGAARGETKRRTETRPSRRSEASESAPVRSTPTFGVGAPRDAARRRPTVWRPPAITRKGAAAAATVAGAAKTASAAASFDPLAARTEPRFSAAVSEPAPLTRAEPVAPSGWLHDTARTAAPFNTSASAEPRRQDALRNTPVGRGAMAGGVGVAASATPRMASAALGSSASAAAAVSRAFAAGASGSAAASAAVSASTLAATAVAASTSSSTPASSAGGPASRGFSAHGAVEPAATPLVQSPFSSPAPQRRSGPPPVAGSTAARAAAASAPPTRSPKPPRPYVWPSRPERDALTQTPTDTLAQSARATTLPAYSLPATPVAAGSQAPLSPGVLETLRSIEENTARWTSLAGASLARRSGTDEADASGMPGDVATAESALSHSQLDAHEGAATTSDEAHLALGAATEDRASFDGQVAPAAGHAIMDVAGATAQTTQQPDAASHAGQHVEPAATPDSWAIAMPQSAEAQHTTEASEDSSALWQADNNGLAPWILLDDELDTAHDAASAGHVADPAAESNEVVALDLGWSATGQASHDVSQGGSLQPAGDALPVENPGYAVSAERESGSVMLPGVVASGSHTATLEHGTDVVVERVPSTSIESVASAAAFASVEAAPHVASEPVTSVAPATDAAAHFGTESVDSAAEIASVEPAADAARHVAIEPFTSVVAATSVETAIDSARHVAFEPVTSATPATSVELDTDTVANGAIKPIVSAVQIASIEPAADAIFHGASELVASTDAAALVEAAAEAAANVAIERVTSAASTASVEPAADAAANVAIELDTSPAPTASVEPAADATANVATEPDTSAAPAASVEPAADAAANVAIEPVISAAPAASVEPAADSAANVAIEPVTSAAESASAGQAADAAHHVAIEPFTSVAQNAPIAPAADDASPHVATTSTAAPVIEAAAAIIAADIPSAHEVASHPRLTATDTAATQDAMAAAVAHATVESGESIASDDVSIGHAKPALPVAPAESAMTAVLSAATITPSATALLAPIAPPPFAPAEPLAPSYQQPATPPTIPAAFDPQLTDNPEPATPVPTFTPLAPAPWLDAPITSAAPLAAVEPALEPGFTGFPAPPAAPDLDLSWPALLQDPLPGPVGVPPAGPIDATAPDLSTVVHFPRLDHEPSAVPPEPQQSAPAARPVVRGHAPTSFEFRPPAASSVELPGLDLLEQASSDIEPVSEARLAETGQLIEQRLQEFKVPVTVVGASAGPVITRFEIEPALGVRGSQIVGLMKDLSRGLGLTSIRVVETIPGKTCMGLELPNARRQMIRLSEILESVPYERSPSRLTIALGKDIIGQPIVTDLAKAPHMLVAGTTGSGKSVAINAMILSLLYKATPEDVRLIMIDPKMLELSVYEGIPHLLAPVVTDMKLAANALNWCVGEMEKRYRLMSAVGVRNLASFNQKIRDAEAHERKIGNPFSLTPEAPEPLSTLPMIVVVIDELADLMMVAGKKIEELIARLAQKARAAGIHLILATQRPSVDVITGLIKANIPTRVAFQVSSKIDSRTILDQMGAESLLGQGDMLLLPPGTGYPQRVHGAFVADEEVHAVVEYLKQFGEPEYVEGILDGPASDGATQDLFGDAPDVEADPLYDEAVAFVVRTRRASISSVQRQLRIGYNRAARLVEQMEAAGLVSPMGINGSREVLAPGGPAE